MNRSTTMLRSAQSCLCGGDEEPCSDGADHTWHSWEKSIIFRSQMLAR